MKEGRKPEFPEKTPSEELQERYIPALKRYGYRDKGVRASLTLKFSPAWSHILLLTIAIVGCYEAFPPHSDLVLLHSDLVFVLCQ